MNLGDILTSVLALCYLLMCKMLCLTEFKVLTRPPLFLGELKSEIASQDRIKQILYLRANLRPKGRNRPEKRG